MKSQAFNRSKTALAITTILLFGALIPTVQAKSVATIPPKPDEPNIQTTIRNALQEPTQPMTAFIPDQHYDHVIEMVFAIDTTGSMGGLIEGAKSKIWRIINDVTQTQKKSTRKVLVRVGLVAYRDVQDEYETRITPLSSDLDAVYSQLMSFQAAGGGDTPENVRLAMTDSLNRVGWMSPQPTNQSLVKKLSQILFLVGDAPPHDDYRQLPSAQSTAKKARQQHIFVNAIQVGNISETQPIWREIAQNGGGEYFSIAQNGGVNTISTPYDEQLAKLGDDMSTQGLYYGHGRNEEKSKSADYTRAIVAAPLSAKADRAKNKSINFESAYHSSDLVQAVENKTIVLENIKTEDLPDEMQKMSPSEQKAFIQQKITERESLRKQIADLSKQRDSYLRQHESGSADAFDTAVAKALAQQTQ